MSAISIHAHARSPLGSPVSSASSNIRKKVKDIQIQIFEQKNELECTNNELKKVHRMLDPLRISMKKYTDQTEQRITHYVDELIGGKQDQHQKTHNEISVLKKENSELMDTVTQMQATIQKMSAAIAQMQEQVFGNYDSDSEIATACQR